MLPRKLMFEMVSELTHLFISDKYYDVIDAVSIEYYTAVVADHC